MTREQSNTHHPGIPVTWPELIAQNRAPLFQGLDALRTIPTEVADIVADAWNPYPKAESLLGASGMLAQATMVYGPESCHPYWEVVLSILPSAFEEIGEEIVNENRVVASSLLALVNVAQCCGVKVPAEILETTQRAETQWPKSQGQFVKQMSDQERWTIAFAALVAGDMATVETVAGGGALNTTITPGLVFDFNVQGFVRYLASAQLAKARMTDVFPALDNFVQRFPHKLAAGTLRWDDLLYAGRAVFSNMGNEGVNVVAPAMFALITEISLRHPHAS